MRAQLLRAIERNLVAEARLAAIMNRTGPLESAEPGALEAPEIVESAGRADLPDWLKTMQPVEPAAVETRESELPDWFRVLHPAAESPVALPLDWWVQTATDTDEEPLSELPEPYLPPRARAAEKEKVAAAAAASTEVKPAGRKVPQTGPLRQTGPLALPQTGPLGTPEPLLCRLK